jgi:hypothetical protein
LERPSVFNQNGLREFIPSGMHSVVDLTEHELPTLPVWFLRSHAAIVARLMP